MNANLVHDEVNKLITTEEKFESVGPRRASHDKEHILVVSFSVVGGILLFLVLLYLCKRRRKRRKLRKEPGTYSNSTIATTSSSVYTVPSQVQLTTEDVTRRYGRSVSALSTKSQIYLVPFSALPPNFDFASREVEVRADYVILKDLRLLERYNSVDSSSNDGGVVNEAYQTQDAYNPYYYKYIPPLVQEPYKKQVAYNPTFY